VTVAAEIRASRGPGTGAVERAHAVRFDRIQQLRAHEYVADQIRRHIALRLVPPGGSLPSERELAAMFGVGRPTVQQALRLLEADHLVEARRGRRGGTFVSRPAEDELAMDELLARLRRRRGELEEVLVYRRAVEPAVTRVAADTRRRADLVALRRAVVSMSAARSETDYMRHDTEFHLALGRATRNRFLVAASEEIRMRLSDAISLLPESDLWHRRISGEHEAVIEAVDARDGQAALAAMEVHVANAEQGLRAVLAAIRRRGVP
jgi:GntR family transcriptional regulator, transcriptional repressor for pyruvate dehydrogenase complex